MVPVGPAIPTLLIKASTLDVFFLILSNKSFTSFSFEASQW